MMNRAVFLDKDGTLIDDIPYNVDPDLIKLSADCIEGLKLLQKENYLLIIISNQSGIARGYFEAQALKQVRSKLNELLQQQGVALNGFYYCPHHPEGTIKEYAIDCNCRKPNMGMLMQAANDLNINLHNSWMIGDILNDIEAGNRAGCRSLLIDNGNETEWLMNAYRCPEQKFKTINEAAKYIIVNKDVDKRLDRV